MQTDSQVVVVGAGPAGCAAAIQCAQAGLSVTILEREIFPRNRPGETLPPAIEPLLNQLGLGQPLSEANFPRHKGHWIQWNDELHFENFGTDSTGQWLGYQAWRAEFDQLLVQHAKTQGVNVYFACSARSPVVHQHKVIGIKTDQGDIATKFIIDATGQRCWLGRQLTLTATKHSPPLVCRFAYLKGQLEKPMKLPAIIATDSGWIWTAQIRSDLFTWVRLNTVAEKLKSDWCPDNLPGLNRIDKIVGADVSWRHFKNSAGHGYFLVGDAAAQLDPLSSHGVLKAIMSGMMAGHIIDGVINKGQSEENGVNQYCSWLQNWYLHDVRRMRELYGQLAKPPRWCRDT